MNPHDIAPLLHPLAALAGVSGVALFDKDRCYLENLPGLDVHGLMESVNAQSSDSSASSSEFHPQIFHWGTATLALFVLGSFKLGVLLGSDAPMEPITAKAKEISKRLTGGSKHSKKRARIHVIRWRDFRPVIQDAVSHVIAPAIAQTLVEREMRYKNIHPDQHATPQKLREFTESLLQQIPMKSRHDQVRTEMENHLRSLKLE